jgi:phage tail-like protein
MLADDPMVVAFLDGLDEVLAPVLTTMDCFDAYLDPRLAPLDMVAYLGSWIRADVRDALSESALRDDVARAHRLAKISGTAEAIRDRVVPRFAQAIEVIDPGTVLTSVSPTNPDSWIEPADGVIHVRVTPLESPTETERLRVEGLIRDVTPAHVVVEVLWN